MIRTLLTSATMLVLLFSISFSAGAETQQPVSVMPRPDDCINTFILRVNVAASNTGAAYGNFEGSQIQMLRRGTNQQNCRVEMVQWGQAGQVEDQKVMQCFFEYPLGN